MDNEHLRSDLNVCFSYKGNEEHHELKSALTSDKAKRIDYKMESGCLFFEVVDLDSLPTKTIMEGKIKEDEHCEIAFEDSVHFRNKTEMKAFFELLFTLYDLKSES